MLKRGVKPSTADLEWLAFQLNFICLHRKLTLESPAKQARWEAVQHAIATLGAFFQERRRMCRLKNGKGPSARVIKSEQQWRDQFARFLRATKTHDEFLLSVPDHERHEVLETDVDDGALSAPFDSWRVVAGPVATFFKTTIWRNNPKLPLGRSNDGPVPRFVAAVVPFITRERPTVSNVGKHLKDEARKLRRRVTKQGQPASQVVPGQST